MELMSPAGNFESFLMALESGADSVYLGFKKFNARKPAKNFSIYQLKKAVKIAHDKNKKVYLALNIDLKSNELKEAVSIIQFANSINIDAVIVKDPSLINIIHKFFNKLKIHLSTQASVSSSLGVKFAKELNIARVILSRELTIDEIKKASTIEGIEIEIFTEGSMCFSISGRCLMSSWVGSRSGNRGLCMAPCRVIWNKENKLNTYFSMKDLSIIRFLGSLKDSNIKALKIEGRLKNALWVKMITGFYRKALDNIEHLKNVENLIDELKKYSAREISSGHLFSHDELTGENKDWNKYEKIESNYNEALYKEKNEIHINFIESQIKITFKIFENESNLYIKIPSIPKKAKPISLTKQLDLIKNDAFIIENNFQIYINKNNITISSTSIQKIKNEIINHIKNIIKKEEALPELSKDILEFIQPKKVDIKRDKKLGEFPDNIIITGKQIEKIQNMDIKIDTIVVSLENEINIEKLKSLQVKHIIIISIPAVMYENKAKEINKKILNLYNSGFNDFEANSLTGMEILRKLNCNKSLGIDYPIMNHLSGDFYNELGFKSVYCSTESEISVYKSLSGFSKISLNALVFGRIILFQSRVDSPAFQNNMLFKDKFNVEIECIKLDEINIFVSTKCFSLVGEKIKNENIYFNNLTADLRYFKEPIKILKKLNNNSFKDITTFNFYERLI